MVGAVSQSQPPVLRVGSRESRLALEQTGLVVSALESAFPGLACTVVAVTTTGDRILDRPLSALGGRGVFVKELEESLLSGQVDLVVHSLKDLPTVLPAGLTLGAVLAREDPRDALVTADGRALADLPAGSRVATSSRRRAAQLLALRGDLRFQDVRGNIQTRLRKLAEGQCDAMVLAAAGLIRLGLDSSISQLFDTEICTPAVGQGALAVELRSGDTAILDMVRRIDDQSVRQQTTAERAFLDALGGGCSVPIGANCTSATTGELRLTACVAALDGSRLIRHVMAAPAEEASRLGLSMADYMLNNGAGDILDQLRQSAPSTVSPP